jgi:hypothetical protein
MTDPALIFRAEALRSLEAQAPPARTQRPEPPRWIAVAYWAVLTLIAAGLAVGLLIRVGDVARGPAVIQDGVVEAVVPAAFAPDLHPGLPLELSLPGRAPVTVTITSTGPEAADAKAASTLLRTKVSEAGPLLLIKATAPQRAEQGATGTVTVRFGDRPLIVALATGLASGAGDG